MSEAKPSGDVAAVEWTWKTDAMRAMAIAVCELAIERGVGGEFSALDLPRHGAEAHGGSGIAGTVFGHLAHGGILGPVGAFFDGAFFQKRVRNPGGNPIGVWRLVNPGLARALLERHGRPRPPVYEQLDLCAERRAS